MTENEYQEIRRMAMTPEGLARIEEELRRAIGPPLPAVGSVWRTRAGETVVVVAVGPDGVDVAPFVPKG